MPAVRTREMEVVRNNAVADRTNNGRPVGQTTEIDLVELAIRLLDKWYWIALAAVIGLVLSGIYTFFIVTPMYESTAKLYVVNSKDSAINLSDLQIGNYLAKDYREVFNNWHVHERVLTELGLDYTYTQLNKMVSVSNPSDTRILAVTVSNPDPVEAQKMAEMYARVACEFIAVKMDQEQPNVFEEARVPILPSSPNKARNLAIGILLGALLAMAVITIQFVMDDRIRTPEDIEKILHVPTLGTVTEQASFAHGRHHSKRSKKKTGSKESAAK